MKAAPFDYIRPDTLDDACACLASHPDARIIAGGQSLVPMLAMRLARPSLVIDIAHIDGLSAIRDDGDALVIGTMVRQAAALSDPLIATHLPLLAKALTHVGHPPTRSRGTVGGSLVHADPSAEIPLVAVALGASLRMRDSDGDIDFDAADFFIGPMLTLIPHYSTIGASRLRPSSSGGWNRVDESVPQRAASGVPKSVFRYGLY